MAQPQGARPRKLVAHILPARAPDEPSAAEVKLRMISRLQELKREGVGGSALAGLLSSLQQQQPAGTTAQKSALRDDDRAAATIQAAYRGRRARRAVGARVAPGKPLSPAAMLGNPATPPSTPPNRPGSAARVTPDGRPLSPSSRSLASFATPPGAGVALFRRRGSFGSVGSSSPPGSATSIRSMPGGSQSVHRDPSWVGTTPLGFDSTHDVAGALARRGSMGSVSIDGSVASSAGVGGAGTAPHTPVPGSPHASDMRTPDGAEIGTLFPQRDATGSKHVRSLDSEPGVPQSSERTRMLEPSVTVSSDGDRQIVQQQARELDERLERLREREAELAALVVEEREIAAREEKRREQMAEQDIAAKRQELMQAHNRRSAQFLPNGKFGADVGEVDRPFLRSQPGAAQPLRSAEAAAEEEARREIAARARDPEYGATMIQAAFRGHAARRARSQKAAASARRRRTKVPAVFQEVHSQGGGRARILAVATLTDPAQVGFMPEVRDSADYATAAQVRTSGSHRSRPVVVPRKEQEHQHQLAQFGERLRAIEQMAAGIATDMSDTHEVLDALETQQNRWEREEELRAKRGTTKIDRILAEARDAQMAVDQLAEEEEHLALDAESDEDGSSPHYIENPALYGLAPHTPQRTPPRSTAKRERRAANRSGAKGTRKPWRRDKPAGSDVEALHGKIGDALSLLGSMLD